MTNADQVLDRIIAALRENNDVRAVWLAGSRGRGTHDEFSDIDIWVALEDETIAPVNDDPLGFVRGIVPTVMHIHAPSIAPSGGAFLGSWVPVEDEFVQVDWYFTPASTATRNHDTTVIYGTVSIAQATAPVVPASYARTKGIDNLSLALLMVSNMVKHARRGHLWRVADHARHADNCLNARRSFLTSGSEPGFVATQESLLEDPPPTTAREAQDLALKLLAETERLADKANAGLDEAIDSVRTVVSRWRESGWKPTEEYYRTLPRSYIGSGMLITDADDNVLLVETTYKGQFEIPGGVVEASESHRDTAGREVHEELGIEIKPGRLLIFDSRSQPAPKGDAVMLLYDGGVIESTREFQLEESEIRRVHFVSTDDLDQVCTPKMATRLRAAIRARGLGTTIEIHDGEIVSPD